MLLHFLLFWKSLLSAFNDQIFAPKIVKGIPQQQGSVPYSVDLGIGYLLEALFDKWTCSIWNFSFDRKLVTLVLAHIQSYQPNWQAFKSMLCVCYNNIHRLLLKIPWYPLLRCSKWGTEVFLLWQITFYICQLNSHLFNQVQWHGQYLSLVKLGSLEQDVHHPNPMMACHLHSFVG